MAQGTIQKELSFVSGSQAITATANSRTEFEIGFWKWMFTTAFHWFNFKKWKDYRKTKCPYCSKKSYMKR
jgi:hypothetical protein